MLEPSSQDSPANSGSQGSSLLRPSKPSRNVKRRHPCIRFSRGKRCSSEFATKLEDALKLLDQASLAWDEGQQDQAIRLIKEVIRIEEACLGPDSVAVAIARVQLGAYLFLAGRSSEAEIVLFRGASSLARFPDRDKETVTAKALLSELYLNTGRPAEAEAMASAVLDQCARTFGPRSVEMVRLLVSAGRAAEARGKLADATARFEEALAICDAGSDGLPLEEILPVVLGALVRVWFTTGANERAMRYLERLLRVLPDDDTGLVVEDWPDDGDDEDQVATSPVLQGEPASMAPRSDSGSDD